MVVSISGYAQAAVIDCSGPIASGENFDIVFSADQYNTVSALVTHNGQSEVFGCAPAAPACQGPGCASAGTNNTALYNCNSSSTGQNPFSTPSISLMVNGVTLQSYVNNFPGSGIDRLSCVSR